MGNLLRKILNVLVSLSISAIAVTNSTQIPCSKTGDISETIDSGKYQCCRGKVELIQDGKECCYETGEFYFKQNTLCCNGRLISLPIGLNGNDAECCGNKVYNINNKFCCGNKTHEKKPNSGCCDGYVFDIDIHRCNQYEHRKPIPDPWDRCGDYNISLFNQSCCSGVPNNVPYYLDGFIINKNLRCCGSQGINIQTQKCCYGDHVISKHLRCCGKGSFDAKTEICCERQVTKIIGQADACCHSNPYNPKIQGCCGQNTFNSTTHKCCLGHDGESVQNITANCCGQNVLPPDSVCCRNDFPVKKDSPEDDKCCASRNGNGNSYNSKTKDCLRGKGDIYTKGIDEQCGGTLIKTKSELCCWGARRVRAPHMDCCGVDTYNTRKQLCCQSLVFNISPEEGRCCENKGYKLTDLPDKCRSPANSQQSMKIIDTKVCGGIQYDTTIHVCCGDRLFPRYIDEERSEQELCRMLAPSGQVKDTASSMATSSLLGIFVSILSLFSFHILIC